MSRCSSFNYHVAGIACLVALLAGAASTGKEPGGRVKRGASGSATSPAENQGEIGPTSRSTDTVGATPRAEEPPPWPDSLSVADRATYIEEVRKLLAAGWEGRSSSVQTAATEHFKAAKAACDLDPRLPYAMGLVLYKQGKYPQAMTQFKRATKRGLYPYLPAFQAAVWVSLSKLTKHDAAFEQLPKLAKSLEEAKTSWPSDAARDDGAEWMGKIVGYLRGPSAAKNQGMSAAQLDASLRELLSASRRQRYEQGKQAILDEFKELGGRESILEMTETVEPIEEKPGTEVGEKTDAEKQAAAATEQCEARLSELKSKLVETKKGYDALSSELTRLQPIIRGIVERLSAVINRLSVVNSLMSRKARDVEKGGENNEQERREFEREERELEQEKRELEPEKKKLEEETVKLNQELGAVEQQWNNTVVQVGPFEQQHQALVKQYDETVAEYRQLTGKTLEKWKKLRHIHVPRNQFGKPPKKPRGKSTGSTVKERQLHELARYWRYDVEAEKRRVLDSLGPAAR